MHFQLLSWIAIIILRWYINLKTYKNFKYAVLIFSYFCSHLKRDLKYWKYKFNGDFNWEFIGIIVESKFSDFMLKLIFQIVHIRTIIVELQKSESTPQSADLPVDISINERHPQIIMKICETMQCSVRNALSLAVLACSFVNSLD